MLDTRSRRAPKNREQLYPHGATSSPLSAALVVRRHGILLSDTRILRAPVTRDTILVYVLVDEAEEYIIDFLVSLFGTCDTVPLEVLHVVPPTASKLVRGKDPRRPMLPDTGEIRTTSALSHQGRRNQAKNHRGHENPPVDRIGGTEVRSSMATIAMESERR